MNEIRIYKNFSSSFTKYTGNITAFCFVDEKRFPDRCFYFVENAGQLDYNRTENNGKRREN